MIFTGRTDMPFGNDVASRFLPWLVALMVFQATLALAGTQALNALLDRWNADVAGTLTVQVPPPDDGTRATDDAAAIEARIEAVLTRIRQDPAVQSATRLTDTDMAALLEPWLGRADNLAGLPLPVLIDVELHRGQRPDLDTLRADLADLAPGVLVDDHREWLRNLVNLARGIEMLAWIVLGMVAFATTATVAYATRTSLMIHQSAIEVLHMIGAHDDYIARQFGARALKLAAVGGVSGFVLALPTIVGIGELAEAVEGAFVKGMQLSALVWASLILVPLGAIVISAGTARLTVHRVLQRMP